MSRLRPSPCTGLVVVSLQGRGRTPLSRGILPAGRPEPQPHALAGGCTLGGSRPDSFARTRWGRGGVPTARCKPGTEPDRTTAPNFATVRIGHTSPPQETGSSRHTRFTQEPALEYWKTRTACREARLDCRPAGFGNRESENVFRSPGHEPKSRSPAATLCALGVGLSPSLRLPCSAQSLGRGRGSARLLPLVADQFLRATGATILLIAEGANRFFSGSKRHHPAPPTRRGRHQNPGPLRSPPHPSPPPPGGPHAFLKLGFTRGSMQPEPSNLSEVKTQIQALPFPHQDLVRSRPPVAPHPGPKTQARPAMGRSRPAQNHHARLARQRPLSARTRIPVREKLVAQVRLLLRTLRAVLTSSPPPP